MYNLRSNKKDTIQFPVQIQVTDDEQFLTDLLKQNSSLLNSSANMSDCMHESSDIEVDYDALIQDSDNETQSTSAKSDKKDSDTLVSDDMVYLFVYLGFYVAFNTVQVISRRVVGRAEETST